MNLIDLPLKALIHFDAVARAGSLAMAAQEIGVTPSAVSQQIKALEDRLGVGLIDHRRGRLKLTEAGLGLAEELAPALTRLDGAVDRARAAGGAGDTVTLAVLSTLAERWLIPRLGALDLDSAGIELRLIAVGRGAELDRVTADVILGTGPLEVGCDPVLPAPLVCVGAPYLTSPVDLTAATLIEVEAAPRTRDWPDYLDALGMAGWTPPARLRVSNSAHGIEAAAAGLGLIVTLHPFVADALVDGRLALAHPHRFDRGDFVYVKTLPQAARRVAVARFRQRLKRLSGPQTG